MLEPAEIDERVRARLDALTPLSARLHNVTAAPSLACSRCGGADSRAVCWKCNEWVGTGEAADRVLPLAYAFTSTQFRKELRMYKDPGADDKARGKASQTLKALLWSFAYHHASCLDRVSQTPPRLGTIVPSGRIRQGLHPFENVARFAPATWARVDAVRQHDIAERECEPDSLAFSSPALIQGQHVVVLDDAWTTGSKAEGVAMAARRLGASEVTVVAVGRIVNQDYIPYGTALHDHVRATQWSPAFCPVTRGDCP